MIEQTPVENEPKPDAAPDEPPAVDLSTNVTGSGAPDGFGLGRSTGSSTGRAGSGDARSRWGWYAGQVQSRLLDRLRNHPKLRSATLRLEVRIWADASGRVTKSDLASTTGDPALDQALKTDVLQNFRFQEPPPAGMPMPIHLRIAARRP